MTMVLLAMLLDLKLAAAPTPLLGDRLRARLPAGARVEPRSAGVMSAAEAQEDETRAVLDSGAARLVIMVYELYATAGADLEAGVRKDVAASYGAEAAKVKLESLAVAAPLRAVAMIPPPPDGKRDANLVYGAYVAQADGTVQVLAFYVNPAAVRDAAAWTATAKAVALTLAPGPRALALQAGDRTFPGAGKDKLVITVPAGIAASTQDGPDFSVYHLRRLGPLGETAAACGVYIGGHPSYHWRQQRQPQPAATPGKLLGADADWYLWSTGGHSTAEAMVAHPLEPRLQVHASCTGTSPAQLDELRKVLGTLRVEK